MSHIAAKTAVTFSKKPGNIWGGGSMPKRCRSIYDI